MMIKFGVLIVLLLFVSYRLYLWQAILGVTPSGTELEKIKQNKYYQEGKFVNAEPTSEIREGASYLQMALDFIRAPKNLNPSEIIPVEVPNLKRSRKETFEFTWFGHSSYLIDIDSLRILVDPVFGPRASPIPGFASAYTYSNSFNSLDFESIDFMVITHDHYDHLDYQTILKLKEITKHYIVPPGLGAHLRYWGISNEKISELSWHQTKILDDHMEITACEARHFSGRGFLRNQSHWNSYVLNYKGQKIYLGGDSGYGKHFKSIGTLHGPFDLVILENGQYGTDWPSIHMFPEEVVQASIDLQSTTILPVHWGKFSLALHPWKEPIEKLIFEAQKQSMHVLSPKIGETFTLKTRFTKNYWWDQIK